MFRRIFNSSIALMVVVLLMLNGISHDFIHVFTHHTDTVHCKGKNESGKKYFENEHHHCHFLDIESSVFILPFSSFHFFVATQHQYQFLPYWQNVAFTFAIHSTSRGPPYTV